MKIFYITFSIAPKGWDDDDYNPYAGFFYANIEAENIEDAKCAIRGSYPDMDIFFESAEVVQ